MKTVFAFDYQTRAYIGTALLNDTDLSPLEEGVYLVPGNCTEVAPPEVLEGQVATWDGAAWSLVDLPADPVPE